MPDRCVQAEDDARGAAPPPVKIDSERRRSSSGVIASAAREYVRKRRMTRDAGGLFEIGSAGLGRAFLADRAPALRACDSRFF
jgi:hypothetical protein